MFKQFIRESFMEKTASTRAASKMKRKCGCVFTLCISWMTLHFVLTSVEQPHSLLVIEVLILLHIISRWLLYSVLTFCQCKTRELTVAESHLQQLQAGKPQQC